MITYLILLIYVSSNVETGAAVNHPIHENSYEKKIDEDVTILQLLKKLNLPRCGFVELVNSSIGFSSMVQAGQTKWSKNSLTFSIQKYSKDMKSRKIDKVFKNAFKLWRKVTPLSFIKEEECADIQIRFETKAHGDGADFDGPGNIYAHAFGPEYGFIHFDDDEHFTDGVSHGINLLWVAAHEIGHALGLRDSKTKGSIMYPFYDGYKKDLKLHDEDVKKIQALYGTPGSPIIPPKTDCKNKYGDEFCKKFKKEGMCQNCGFEGCKKECNRC